MAVKTEDEVTTESYVEDALKMARPFEKETGQKFNPYHSSSTGQFSSGGGGGGGGGGKVVAHAESKTAKGLNPDRVEGILAKAQKGDHLSMDVNTSPPRVGILTGQLTAPTRTISGTVTKIGTGLSVRNTSGKEESAFRLEGVRSITLTGKR